MEFTSHRQSWSQAVQTATSWPAITNGGRSVLRVGCHESRATYTPRTATLATLRTTDRRIQYETFFCDQRNTLLYRTLADEAHPFNPIQEEAQC